MVCLLETNDVVCIWNDMYTKVKYVPLHHILNVYFLHSYFLHIYQLF